MKKVLCFEEWFIENWFRQCGLISAKTASMLLDVTEGAVRSNKNLTKYIYEDRDPLYSMREVLNRKDKTAVKRK